MHLFILVILQVAYALAALLGPSLDLAPLGPAQALFKTSYVLSCNSNYLEYIGRGSIRFGIF